jgi:hypothetical protein
MPIKYSVEMTMPATIENSMAGIKAEDRGEALILYDGNETNETGGDDAFYVRLVSHSPHKDHPLFKSMMGKRLRVTVEDIE